MIQKAEEIYIAARDGEGAERAAEQAANMCAASPEQAANVYAAFPEQAAAGAPLAEERVPAQDRASRAVRIACFFAGEGGRGAFVHSLRELRGEMPELCNFDVRTRLDGLLSTYGTLSGEQSRNVAVACLLFYALSAGKYPQDCWDGAGKRYEETALGKVRAEGEALFRNCERAKFYRIAARLSETLHDLRCEQENRDVAAMLAYADGLGMPRVWEMLWEVFVLKYANFGAEIWAETLSQYAGKTHTVREGCDYCVANAEAEICALSYEGKMQKPGHDRCQDCSFVSVYDEHMWLAVAADGVGSCARSAEGSQAAADCLNEVIGGYLKKNGYLNEHFRKGGRKNQIRRRVAWARLMYFLRFQLAGALFAYWKNSFGEGTEDLLPFATTLQFAFGCDRFIACGRLGDGTFFVRKRERNGTIAGGWLLSDGVSGVTQSAVLSVAKLGADTDRLQVQFFSPREVTDILLSSDGMSPLLGESVADLGALADRLGAMPMDARKREVDRMARRGAECNETSGGSGDDSTLVHVRILAPQTTTEYGGSI